MDAVLKRDWIDALRSGKYKQLRHTVGGDIRTGTCAVGLLGYLERGNGDSPPGYPMSLSMIARRRVERMNDYERMSFPEIADWIEDNVRGEA